MALRCMKAALVAGVPIVLDLIFLALTCALFLLGAGYAVLCDRL